MGDQMKHTPGPWYFGNMPGWGDVCILRRPASDYGPTGTVGDAPLAIMVERAPHWETAYPIEANARLIAAAPALLAACKAALADVEEGVLGELSLYAVDQLRAAIKSAEGGQPQ